MTLKQVKKRKVRVPKTQERVERIIKRENMYSTLSELRAAGRADLDGHWGEAVMLTFVYVIICSLLGASAGGALNLILPGCSLIVTVLLLPMNWGMCLTFLSNSRKIDHDPFDIGHLFDGYKNGQFKRIFTTYLLMYIYIVLWTLLLIVPGIIKAISYAMTPYILRDNPELQNNEAIEKSMRMMQGHKARYFFLCLTFIGWILLGILTLGIGLFWVEPYINATTVRFYEELKDQEAEIIEDTPETVSTPEVDFKDEGSYAK